MIDDTISIQQLGEISVVDEHKQRIKISTLWAEKTVVLVFIRHFG